MLIPQEIADAIIQHAENDPVTLYNLCLATSSFLPKAQRILYSEIRINDHIRAAYSVWFIPVERAIRLFKTIVEYNPALARYIRKLHIHTYSKDPEYAILFHQGLRLMSNLESLAGTIPGSIPLKGCTFQLKNFGYTGTYYNRRDSPEMIQFLSLQSSLKSLFVLGDPYPGETLPETFFPALEGLAGNRHAIEKILPYRPLVTKLAWMTHFGADISTPPRTIASCLSNIHTLSLGGSYQRPDIRLFLPYLQSLQVLRVYGESPNLPLCDELSLIPEFPALRVFVWTAGLATAFKREHVEEKMNENAQFPLVKTLFSKTSALERVYIHTFESKLGFALPVRSNTDLQYYLCWRRGGIQPTVVGAPDVVGAHGIMSWYSLEML